MTETETETAIRTGIEKQTPDSAQSEKTPHTCASQPDLRVPHIVIMGATSGIGLAVARLCIRRGWRVGAAGRRTEALEALRNEAPSQVEIETIDVTRTDAPMLLEQLTEKLGGMDIYLHCSGIGTQNPELRADPELATAETNAVGFIRMATAVFDRFRRCGGGRLAAVSSIAGTRGLGAAPAYSATKRMQNTYLDALAQLAHMERLPIRITDLRPGFVSTSLLDDGRRYPMQMRPERVAARIVRALERGRRRAVIDGRYALLVFGWRLIPEWLWERLPIRSGR